jgi:Chaperone of endosialidase
MRKLLIVVWFSWVLLPAYGQRIGVGTNVPHASALLEINSTTLGLLPPRMTAAQRNAIATPANGLIVFDTDSAALMVRSAGGWRRLTTTATPGGFWQISGTNIFNTNSGRVGIGTFTPSARLHVADSNVLFAAPGFAPLPAGPVPISGNGRRMMWYADKAAFRTGFATNTEWDADSIGRYSFASGFGSKASGFVSTAMGYLTVAGGPSSTAVGESTIANGNFSTAMGLGSIARGSASTAMGQGGLAGGDASTAMGTLSQATGFSSLATGFETKATNDHSVSFGQFTHASGVGSLASGIGTRAKSVGSASFGRYNDDRDAPNAAVSAPTDRIFQIGNGANDNFRSNAITVLRNGNIGLSNVDIPNAPLQFSSTSQIRKIVLYENVNNDHQFIGFGVEGFNIGGPFGLVGGALRYQTDAIGTDHVFYSAASAAASNELLRIKGNGNVGIGAAGTNAPLQFANTTVNRKIVLYEGANNDHQYYGFGINNGVLRYQTDASNADHVFYSAASASASNELLRIKGNGTIGVNQPNPGVYGHGGTARALEIWNNSGVGSDVQSHLVLSTSGSGGSMGGVTWATTALGGEQKAAFIGAAYEAGSNDALFQVMLRRNGSLAQRFRVNSDGSAFLQGTLTQNSDVTLKKNIEQISDAGALLSQLHGYRYQWKDENADAERQLGLLAQEVQKVLPELVKEGENGKLGVNYSGLIPVLLEAIKEQLKQSEKQQLKIDMQQNQLDDLKKLVQQLVNTKQ